jgi:hypothetical protein
VTVEKLCQLVKGDASVRGGNKSASVSPPVQMSESVAPARRARSRSECDGRAAKYALAASSVASANAASTEGVPDGSVPSLNLSITRRESIFVMCAR